MNRKSPRLIRPVYLGLALFALTLTANAEPEKTDSRLPGPELNLVLDAPITTWDEAIPLGNGLLGGLLWGEGNTIRLSLDRGDLWDLRIPATISEKGFTYRNLQNLVRSRNEGEINRLFEAPYGHSTPTKIPAGRVEIILDPSRAARRFELNLATAEGRVELDDGGRIDAFLSAVAPVGFCAFRGRRRRRSASGSLAADPAARPVRTAMRWRPSATHRRPSARMDQRGGSFSKRRVL